MNANSSISIPKENLPNEDRMVLQDSFFAVADGAGGTGILCGEWAEFVLGNLPLKSIETYAEFLIWVEGIVESFVDSYESLIAKDSYQLRKFYEEGSACTLACAWIEGNIIHWITYGDAHVFKVGLDSFESHPFQFRDQLSDRTYLLNWSHIPDAVGFSSGSFTLEKGDKLLLATDELAKHIFYLKENATDFLQAIDTLQKAAQSEESLRQYINTHHDIGEDDYTLLIIEP